MLSLTGSFLDLENETQLQMAEAEDLELSAVNGKGQHSS